MKNLRHSSLNSNVFNAYVKFQMCVMHNERDIHIQKIKVKKHFLDTFCTRPGNRLSISIFFITFKRLYLVTNTLRYI